MTKQELIQKLQAKGLESAHLDEIVITTACSIASSVNNGGMEDQIQFMLDNGVTAEWILDNV